MLSISAATCVYKLNRTRREYCEIARERSTALTTRGLFRECRATHDARAPRSHFTVGVRNRVGSGAAATARLLDLLCIACDRGCGRRERPREHEGRSRPPGGGGGPTGCRMAAAV